ncbi:MAG: enoyl-CoA hydratase [Alphaproteobacteria bacterium]|nr:enoyl-CoA hydratase [Alphaproteobacteria bacterium]
MADVTLETEGALAIISLNRPEKRNALTLAMWRAIPALVESAAQSGARVLVVAGRGGHFAAGADIAEFEDAYASADAALANQGDIQAAMRALEAVAMPVLAQIDGVCVGGGCGLALACDLRWATPSARFAITPARLGLAYGVADTHRLIRAVGLSHAKDMLFTGRMIDAPTALAWGLIDRIVSAEAMDAECAAFGHALAGAARYSLAAIKRIAHKAADGAVMDDEESRRLFAEAFSGPDFAEGYRAFLEKRAPKFS